MADLSNWTDNPYKSGGTPDDFARWERDHCGPYKDHLRVFEHDEAWDMPSPHEIAERKIARLMDDWEAQLEGALEAIYWPWYPGKEEDVERSIRAVLDIAGKLAEQREIYKMSYAELKERIEQSKINELRDKNNG